MLVEITTSILAGGLIGYSHYQNAGGSNDAIKIQRICANNGLTVKEDGKKRNMQLLRRSAIKQDKESVGTEYAYRIPLGLSFKDFENKLQHIQDGLNNKQTIIDISFNDLKRLKLDRNLFQAIKLLLKQKKRLRKEIELSYDGLLIIRVYNTPLTDDFHYTKDLLDKCKGWEVPIGVTRTQFIKHDFDKRYNMIVAGSPGYGKSVSLKNIITTLVARKTKEVKFSLIDLKGGLAFNRFSSLEQVETVAKTPKEALDTLQTAQQSMNETMDYLLANGYEDVKEAGFKERHFIIIDEAADLSDEKEALEIVKDIARRGRGAGFRLVYATQYPTNETLPSQVRQNCDARLCFKLQTGTASRAVLDEEGAESLPFVLGRAIYQTDRKTVVQTPLISNAFIDETIRPNIIIKGRKERNEQQHEERSTKTAKAGKHTLILEETPLS